MGNAGINFEWWLHSRSDTVCINSGDLNEGKAQVQQMHRTYEESDTVWVWLGNGDPYSDRFRKLLDEMRGLWMRAALDGDLTSFCNEHPYYQAGLECFPNGLPGIELCRSIS